VSGNIFARNSETLFYPQLQMEANESLPNKIYCDC
jgi:hypothetical protein